jgi:hypothetical protein
MRKLILFLFLFIVSVTITKAQNWTEGFETSDSLTLPAGWTKWNVAGFPIDPASHWTVRDTGVGLPGLASATSKSHSGRKAVGVSWVSGVDTNTANLDTSDVWLVTKRIRVWNSSAIMTYWSAVGTANFLDSLQIWVSTVDSTPASFTHYIETLSGNGPYGQFSQNVVPIGDYVGQTIWVGFRYYMDVDIDGFFVHLDDVQVTGNIGITPISTEIPKKFELKQNYPNPFNPVTNIEFDIAKTSPVKLIIYNSVGQEVTTLINQELKPGSYKYDFNADKLPSGAYFYRLIAGDFVKTNKMILVK